MRFCRSFTQQGNLEKIFLIYQKEDMDFIHPNQLNILRIIKESYSFENNGNCSIKPSKNDCIFLIVCLVRFYRIIEKNQEPSENIENEVDALFILLEIFGEISTNVNLDPILQDAIFNTNLIVLCIGKFCK